MLTTKGTGWVGRQRRRFGGVALALAVLGVTALQSSPASAARAEVEAKEEQGYGRVVMSFDQLPSFDARISTGVLVVTFQDAITASMEQVVASLPGYVTAARRDPDGKAVRMALSRPLTVNTMQAGEKLFIDFLPQGWVGFPPSLPRDVVAELNRKARAAQKAQAELKKLTEPAYAPLTLDVGSNPTFTRLIFDLHAPVPASHTREGDTVTVTITAPLPFNAPEAVTILPPNVSELASSATEDSLQISFKVDPALGLRGFREENKYIVDLTPPTQGAAAPASAPPASAPAATAPPPPAEAAPAAPAAAAPQPSVVPVEAGKAVPLPQPRPSRSTAADTAKPAEGVQSAEARPQVPAEASPVPPVVAGVASQAPNTEAAAPVAPKAADVTAAPLPPTEAPKAAASSPPPSPAAPQPDAPAKAVDAAAPSVRRVRDLLEVVVPFTERPPAAAFLRGSTLWLVFDSKQTFDLSFLVDDTSGLVTDVEQERTDTSQIIRIALSEPRLISLIADGTSWVVALGDTVVEPAKPIYLSPGFAGDGRAAVKTTLEGIGGVHWLEDPEVGDRLAVVTLQGPARAVVRPHAFVEFRALSTVHGVVVQAIADDVSVTAGLVDLVITRDGGLTLSQWDTKEREPQPAYVSRKPELNAGPFQAGPWNEALAKPYREGAADELRLAAAAGANERARARLSLARFQLAHGNGAEAKAVLDVMQTEDMTLNDRTDIALMYAAALIELRRFDEALKLLGRGDVSDLHQAQLWKSVAEANLGRLSRAREAYRKGAPALNSMPEALQVLFRQNAAEVAIEARDYSTAAIELDAIDAIGSDAGSTRRALLRARIADGLGQAGLAIEGYRTVLTGDDPIAAAEARFRSTKLRHERGEMGREDAMRELELMSVGWRGDAIEAEVLASLGELYTADKRWRDAFEVMRTAINVHPEAEITRTLQQNMSERFSNIFLTETESIETLDALALFLDFKELTPPGRRGDEIIRRLADRMVEVDLLDEAADLLEYQIDNRLAGAARSQVAARAAVIHLLNQKPARAYRVLQSTRLAGLPAELRRNRTLLEARALAEIGRSDVGVELVSSLEGPDALLMKADILWQARRWQEAGEGLELLLGTRWRDTGPLSDSERMNVLRSGIAYAMSEDSLGLERLRVKYAGLMANSPDGQAFDTITAPIDARGAAFDDIAKAIAATNTFTSFLDEYRKRYPETAVPVPNAPASAPPAGSAPAPEPAPPSAEAVPGNEPRTAARS